jgi:hypothetical protein
VIIIEEIHRERNRKRETGGTNSNMEKSVEVMPDYQANTSNTGDLSSPRKRTSLEVKRD